MNKNPNLAVLTEKFTDKKYELGKIDCIHMVHDYISEFGVKVPEEFGGVTLDTYKELFDKDPDKARNLMVEFLEACLDEKQIHEAMAGDILVLSYSKSAIFLGICAGNGEVLVVAETGVTCVPMKHYNIWKVFRCQQ